MSNGNRPITEAATANASGAPEHRPRARRGHGSRWEAPIPTATSARGHETSPSRPGGGGGSALRSLAAGHADAERERAFCQRYANRIRAYGLCHLRDATAAEDLVQQVLLAVLEALRGEQVDDVENLEAYVFGTCRNTVMVTRRGSARERRIADESAAAELPDGYEPPWALVDSTRLDQCLGRLEERARSVVLATFVDEREANDIGRSMGLSPGNVRIIRHRALAHLQRCMERGQA